MSDTRTTEEIADEVLMRIATADTEDFDRDKGWIKEALDLERSRAELVESKLSKAIAVVEAVKKYLEDCEGSGYPLSDALTQFEEDTK